VIFIKHKSVGALIDCDYADAFLFRLETNIIGSAQEFVCNVLTGIHIIYRIEDKTIFTTVARYVYDQVATASEHTSVFSDDLQLSRADENNFEYSL